MTIVFSGAPTLSFANWWIYKSPVLFSSGSSYILQRVVYFLYPLIFYSFALEMYTLWNHAWHSTIQSMSVFHRKLSGKSIMFLLQRLHWHCCSSHIFSQKSFSHACFRVTSVSVTNTYILTDIFEPDFNIFACRMLDFITFCNQIL